MKEDTKYTLLGGALLLVIVAAGLGLSAAYNNWVYGDWKCGMPGVQCRKEVAK